MLKFTRTAGHSTRKARQEIQIPDSQQRIHALLHCITGANLDFLEEMEEELGDAITICSDFNTHVVSRIDMAATNKDMH